MENVCDTLKQNNIFGPVAVIVGQLVISLLQHVASCLPDLDGVLFSHSFMAAFLTGVYLFSWSKNFNPHLAVPVDNLLIYELSLTLAAGYYASCIFTSRSCLETIHNIISIMAVSGYLTDGKGANVFVTYVFLVEIGTLFFLLRDCATKCNHPCTAVLDFLYPAVLISTKTLGLWHLTFTIAASTAIPMIHKVESVILTLCSFYFVQESLCKLGGFEVSQPRRRSRENITRVRRSSRSRSSSRGSRSSRSSAGSYCSLRSRSRSISRSRSRSRVRSRLRILSC